jgi:hypothetical protein
MLATVIAKSVIDSIEPGLLSYGWEDRTQKVICASESRSRSLSASVPHEIMRSLVITDSARAQGRITDVPSALGFAIAHEVMTSAYHEHLSS